MNQALPRQYAPHNQADDDQHYRKLDEGEGLLTCVLQWIPVSGLHNLPIVGGKV